VPRIASFQRRKEEATNLQTLGGILISDGHEVKFKVFMEDIGIDGAQIPKIRGRLFALTR
jgi:hypothetical protein